jgi:hypothetical protein
MVPSSGETGGNHDAVLKPRQAVRIMNRLFDPQRDVIVAHLTGEIMGQLFYILAFLAGALGGVFVALGLRAGSGVEWMIYLQMGAAAFVGAVIFAGFGKAIDLLAGIEASSRDQVEMLRFLAVRVERDAVPFEVLGAPIRVLRNLGEVSGATEVQRAAILGFVEGQLGSPLTDRQREHLGRWVTMTMGNMEQDLQALRSMPHSMAQRFRDAVTAIEGRGKSKDENRNARVAELAARVLAIFPG